MGMALLLVVEVRETTCPARETLRRGPRPRPSTAVVARPLGGDGSLATEMKIPGGLPLAPPDGDEVAGPKRRPVTGHAHPSSRRALGRPQRHPGGAGVGFPHPVIPAPLRAGPVAPARPRVAPLPASATLRPAPSKDHPQNRTSIPVTRPVLGPTRTIVGPGVAGAVTEPVPSVRLVVRSRGSAATARPPSPAAPAPAAVRAGAPARATATVAFPAPTTEPAVGPVAPLHGAAVILPVATLAATALLPLRPVPPRPGPIIRLAPLRLDYAVTSSVRSRGQDFPSLRPKKPKFNWY